MTEGADAVLGRRAEGRVDEERRVLAARPALFPGAARAALRSAANLLSAGEEKNCGVGSLEFRDGIELRGRRFDGVLVMVVDGFKCLLLQRGRASVVEQNRVERGRVPRRWNTAKDGDVRRARVIRQRDPRRQWDGVADGCVRLDPRRADSVVVERVVNQERSSGSALSMIRWTSSRVRVPVCLAVAGAAGTPIAAERLLLEELLAVELDPSSSWPSPSERDRSLPPLIASSHRDAQRGKLRTVRAMGPPSMRRTLRHVAGGARSLRCSTSGNGLMTSRTRCRLRSIRPERPMPSETDTSAQARRDLPDAAIRAQLERILASEVFSRSQQLRRFLSFIVEQRLAGQGHSLKESVLAHELYGKGTDFDGGADPVVRVDARRLRDKLREYYEGRSDPVVISLPKGSYVPVFEANSAAPTTRLLRLFSQQPQETPSGREPQAREDRRRRSRARRSGRRRRACLARTPQAGGALRPSCSRWPRTQVWKGPPALSPDGNLVAFAWSGECRGWPDGYLCEGRRERSASAIDRNSGFGDQPGLVP